MRLTVVALLGIEITIIALASAASAATHPEGAPAPSSLYKPRGPAQAMMGRLTDAYAVGPRITSTWAFERLVEAQEHLWRMRDWPPYGGARRSDDLRVPQDVRARPAGFQDTAQPRSEASHAAVGRAEAPMAAMAQAEAPQAGPQDSTSAQAQPQADAPAQAQPQTDVPTQARSQADTTAQAQPQAGTLAQPQADTPAQAQPQTDVPTQVQPQTDVPTQAQPRAGTAARVRSQSKLDRTRTRAATAKVMRSPARTGVAKMPRARSHKTHRRAQVDLERVMPRQAAVRMSHATATGWLKSAGLRTRSTGNCTSKHMQHCTSLDSVRTGTIARVIELKRQSHCPIMVTGGTEEGHAPGVYSHGNGYKLDISHNACIDRYIMKNHDKAGVRSDGAPLYRSSSGTTFADESDHWDILFR
ncbi:hypothetical protein ACTMTI_04460 [Nonomuraea sp. H19]|uniref:hypothetical protein n=1 Tax=Nonomuraea sp. H19 TaxID=3452206 RepID=UPI003F8A9E64